MTVGLSCQLETAGVEVDVPGERLAAAQQLRQTRLALQSGKVSSQMIPPVIRTGTAFEGSAALCAPNRQKITHL